MCVRVFVCLFVGIKYIQNIGNSHLTESEIQQIIRKDKAERGLKINGNFRIKEFDSQDKSKKMLEILKAVKNNNTTLFAQQACIKD